MLKTRIVGSKEKGKGRIELNCEKNGKRGLQYSFVQNNAPEGKCDVNDLKLLDFMWLKE